MKSFLLTLSLIFGFVFLAQAQTETQQLPATPVWTEADRKLLLDNLNRTIQEIKDETKNLTQEQWTFKESPDRWSINQVVEHIGIWELLFMNEISKALRMEPNPSFPHVAPDSLFTDQNPRSQTMNNAMDFTKPFSYAVPLGNNDGKNNVIWVTTMRNESIEYLKKETKNIRIQYDYCSGVNVHQYYLMMFRHSDKHLRQIRKVKAHANYPKSKR